MVILLSYCSRENESYITNNHLTSPVDFDDVENLSKHDFIGDGYAEVRRLLEDHGSPVDIILYNPKLSKDAGNLNVTATKC